MKWAATKRHASLRKCYTALSKARMRSMTRPHRRAKIGLLAVALGVALATAAYAHLKVLKTLPEAGAVVDRPVRELRAWFNQEPDLALSKLELEGPNGALEVSALHTMGEKDLMAQVAGTMPDGAYTARWQTAGDDGHVQKGEWAFTVKRGGG